jgi:hypothetical protein
LFWSLKGSLFWGNEVKAYQECCVQRWQLKNNMCGSSRWRFNSFSDR